MKLTIECVYWKDKQTLSFMFGHCNRSHAKHLVIKGDREEELVQFS